MKLIRFARNIWLKLWENLIAEVLISLGIVWGICFILGFIYRIIGIPYTPHKSQGYFFDTLGLGAIILVVLMGVLFIAICGKSVLKELKKLWDKS